jgi:hypothetical protein
MSLARDRALNIRGPPLTQRQLQAYSLYDGCPPRLRQNTLLQRNQFNLGGCNSS